MSAYNSNNPVLPNTLVMCRQSRAISREDAAKAFGLTEFALWKMETGKLDFPKSLINDAALLYEFPISRFHWEDPPEEWHLNTLFLHSKPEDVCGDCHIAFAEALCDAPLGHGVTCDRPLCLNCRIRMTEKDDLCGYHYRQQHWESEGRDPNGNLTVIK